MRFLALIFLAVAAASAILTKRAAINRDNMPDRLWPKDRPIPYKFNPDFSTDDRPGVKDALKAIASKTCLTFKDVTNESSEEEDDASDEPTIVIKNGTNCNAPTGKMSKPKDVITMTEACREPVTYYELMLYALGMIEIHNRPDRDDYITFMLNNTDPDEVEGFTKTADFVSSTYDVPYDFDSLIHYTPAYRQKSEGLPTMVAKDPLYQPAIGQNSLAPSHSDYLTINRLYRCLDKCAPSESKCQHGGFPNPNDCTKCICPRGFAGKSCNKLDDPEKGCGWSKAATKDWQSLGDDWSLNDEAKVCYWFLTAPAGRQIEIELTKVAPENPECTIKPRNWLEVRLGNFVVGGYKFFCNGHIPNHSLISQGNLTVLTLSKDMDEPIEFQLKFRSVKPKIMSTGSTVGASVGLLLCSLFVAMVI